MVVTDILCFRRFVNSRARLSDGIVIQNALALWYSGTSSPLICDTLQDQLDSCTVHSTRLESRTRFHWGKPAKIVSIDLGLPTSFSDNLFIVGHYAIVNLEITDTEVYNPPPYAAIAINLLTGTLTSLGDPFNPVFGNNTSLCAVGMPNAEPGEWCFECIDLDTQGISIIEDDDLEYWQPTVCFHKSILFSREVGWQEAHQSNIIFLIWSAVSKRSISYDLDLTSILVEERDRNMRILQAYIEKVENLPYLTIQIDSRDEKNHLYHEMVTLRIPFDVGSQDWKPDFGGCKTALPLLPRNSLTDHTGGSIKISSESPNVIEEECCNSRNHVYTLIESTTIAN